MLPEIKPLLDLLDHHFRELRKLVSGLSSEQLNWRPLPDGTQNEAANSLDGRAVHTSLIAISTAAIAAGQPRPDFPEMHNGNTGLTTIGESPDRAIELLNQAQVFVHDVIENIASEQLTEMRERRFGNWVAEPQMKLFSAPADFHPTMHHTSSVSPVSLLSPAAQ